jgi:uncharacterized membrane protein YfcA
MEYLRALYYLCPLIFLAGFIDSAVGGGGTISIPAYMLTGMPTHYVFGTNKLSASLGTALAAGRFIKNRAIDIRTAAVSGGASLIGAAIGSRIALLLDDRTFKILLLAALPCVAVFMALRRNVNIESAASRFTIKKSAALASAIGFCIGMYDGVIGPGTGTFAIIAFNVIMKYDLKIASGNAKVLNLASNIASLFTFARAGNVLYVIGLPTAACCALGNYIGAGFAIKKGVRFLRPMLFAVLAILLIKTTYDLFAPF